MFQLRSTLGAAGALLCAWSAVQPIPAQAYEYKNAEVRFLAEEVKQSFLMQKREVDAERMRSSIERIHQGFISLRRDRIPTDDLLELRFLLQHWRRETSENSLSKALSATVEGEFSGWIQDLQLLRVRLKRESLLALHKHWKASGFKDSRALMLYLADQGDHSVQEKPILRSGPAKPPKFEPIHDGKQRFEEWSRLPDIRQYEFDGDTVVFRGNRFKPGDFLVVDLREDVPGLFSFFEAPRSVMSHLAFFAVVDGVPLAMEIFEHGVRPVPLAVFLSPDFTSYVEIYRLKNFPAKATALMQGELPRIWNEPHAYGFNPQNPDRKYLTCSSVGTLILERLGVTPIEGRTEVDPPVAANLKRVGLDMGGRYLSPTDYMLDPRLELVGWLDNNRLNKNVVDDLVLRRFESYLRNEVIDRERLSWMFQLTSWAASQIQVDSFWSDLFLVLFGFTKDTLPDGTPDGLAFVDLSDKSAKEAIENVLKKRVVADFAQTSPLSIHDLENDPELSRRLDSSLEMIHDWFKPLDR